MKKLLIIAGGAILITFFTQCRIVYGSGESMLPTYPNKALLFCIKTNDYKKGDIVFYQIDKINVIHRIVDIKDDGIIKQYKLKGDNNTYADGYLITSTNIKCKVI